MDTTNPDRFFAFMQERERIRLRKEADEPFPWTEDPILRTYKFTNVKRSDDRTTRVFRDYYEQYAAMPGHIQLINCATFRYFGTTEFANALGWRGSFEPELIKSIAKDRLKAGLKVFTGAYVITNQGIRAPKQDVVVDIFLANLWAAANEIVQIARSSLSWRAVIHRMREIKGFGGTGFMAKEVILDTFFTSMWPVPKSTKGVVPVDLNTWCPAGPGARRGINRLLERELKAPMTEAEALKHMLEMYEARSSLWREDYVPLELHDIQFQLCEFDKYERVRLGQGRPRNKYRPPVT